MGKTVRNRIIIFVGGLVIIILLFWLIVFRSSGGGTSEQELAGILSDLSDQPASTDTFAEREFELPEPKPIREDLVRLSDSEAELREAKNMVRQFVEIWASVSNQDDFTALRLLDDQMTPRARQFRDSYIDDIRQTHPYRQGYFGVTTQVVSVDIPLLAKGGTGGVVTAQVGTRRTESVDDSMREYNQDVEIKLIKIGDKWLVDGVFWREPE